MLKVVFFCASKMCFVVVVVVVVVVGVVVVVVVVFCVPSYSIIMLDIFCVMFVCMVSFISLAHESEGQDWE